MTSQATRLLDAQTVLVGWINTPPPIATNTPAAAVMW
jgi:hypothetical protein